MSRHQATSPAATTPPAASEATGPSAAAHARAAGPAPLRLGSLCSGYEGLGMAIAQVLDVELAWVADPDPGAAAVLAHHHPDVPNLGDITAVDFHQIESVDVVAAGFPCQDISYAGLGAGIKEGTRSGLWYVIAAALGVLRPRLVVLENVRAIVARRPGLDVVLADLARLGFDADWTCLRASDVGAAHQRERWFLVAHAPSEGLQGPRLRRRPARNDRTAADPDRVGDQRDGPAGQPAQRHTPGAGGAPADPASLGGREPADQTLTFAGSGDARPESGGRGVQPAADANSGGRRPDKRDLRSWEFDPRRGAAADTTRDGRQQGRPESTRVIRRPDVALGRGAAPADPDSDAVRQQPVPESGSGGETVAALDDLDWGRYGSAIERWARILGRPAPDPVGPTASGKRGLSPAFVEWLMGLPAGHVTAVPGLTRNQQLKLLGNGVVPRQGAAAIAHLLDRMEAAA